MGFAVSLQRFRSKDILSPTWGRYNCARTLALLFCMFPLLVPAPPAPRPPLKRNGACAHVDPRHTTK